MGTVILQGTKEEEWNADRPSYLAPKLRISGFAPPVSLYIFMSWAVPILLYRFNRFLHNKLDALFNIYFCQTKLEKDNSFTLFHRRLIIWLVNQVSWYKATGFVGPNVAKYPNWMWAFVYWNICTVNWGEMQHVYWHLRKTSFQDRYQQQPLTYIWNQYVIQ